MNDGEFIAPAEPTVEIRNFQRGKLRLTFLDSHDPVPETYENYLCHVEPQPTGVRNHDGNEFTVNGHFSFHADSIDQAFDFAAAAFPIRAKQMIDQFKAQMMGPKILTPSQIATLQNQHNGQYANRFKSPE